MIGSYPASRIIPLGYRYALDAASSALAARGDPVVRCDAPELLVEVRQRFPESSGPIEARGALWIEPRVGRWQKDLTALAGPIQNGGMLVVVASRPLARLLPERRGWPVHYLGLRPGGHAELYRALARAGFATTTYGIHSARATVLNMLGQLVSRFGRPDLGDRLHFAARLAYCATGPLAPLATVALLISRKGAWS